MKIWFISKYASPPNYTKVPSRLYYLAKEAQKNGIETYLITSNANHFSAFPITKKSYNNEYVDGVNIIWIDTYKYKKTNSISRFISWLDFEYKLFKMKVKKEIKPDVVIVSSLSIFTILYGIFLKYFYNAVLIFEIRDIWPLTLTEEGGFSKFNPAVYLIGKIEKLGYKKSDLIVGTMPKLEDHVKKISKWHPPIFCSPLGFDPESYTDCDLLVNNPFIYLKKDNQILIGYAGSMGVSNGLEFFIDAIKQMKDIQNVHFLIVGSGDLQQKYQTELKNFTNVTLLSRIDQKNVKYFLHICDILYLSTKISKVWLYGQSMNKIIEYMLAAKPIVATYTGYQSMINEAECGVFHAHNSPVSLKEIFLYYCNLTHKERVEIGKRGRSWVFQNRSYEKLWREYFNTINELTTNLSRS
jgi:glycosyltransferase involved in cell wall biosynthesis